MPRSSFIPRVLVVAAATLPIPAMAAGQRHEPRTVETDTVRLDLTPLQASGGRDFHGDPTVRVQLELSVHDGTSVGVQMVVTARKGRTVFTDTTESIIYSAPRGFRVIRIVEPRNRVADHTLKSKGKDGRYMDGKGMVVRWFVLGDSPGPDLGRTSVVAWLRPLTIQIEQEPGERAQRSQLNDGKTTPHITYIEVS